MFKPMLPLQGNVGTGVGCIATACFATELQQVPACRSGSRRLGAVLHSHPSAEVSIKSRAASKAQP